MIRRATRNCARGSAKRLDYILSHSERWREILQDKNHSLRTMGLLAKIAVIYAEAAEEAAVAEKEATVEVKYPKSPGLSVVWDYLQQELAQLNRDYARTDGAE